MSSESSQTSSREDNDQKSVVSSAYIWLKVGFEDDACHTTVLKPNQNKILYKNTIVTNEKL